VFFDDFSNESQINGMEILGKTASIEKAFSENIFDEIIIGFGYKHLEVKKKFFDNLKSKIPFAKIIHSSCWIDKSATIEEGCIIYPGCLIDANAVIKSNTVLNIGCTIAHDSTVGPHCFLSPRVAVAGFVTINEQCFIGINSTIIDSISINGKTRIGGATVVIKSIEKSGLYVGNPAKFIKL
jgi:sugar O-acyltransferase (sialic acid O-acetyltransferase NeuD family)